MPFFDFSSKKSKEEKIRVNEEHPVRVLHDVDDILKQYRPRHKEPEQIVHLSPHFLLLVYMPSLAVNFDFAVLQI